MGSNAHTVKRARDAFMLRFSPKQAGLTRKKIKTQHALEQHDTDYVICG